MLVDLAGLLDGPVSGTILWAPGLYVGVGLVNFTGHPDVERLGINFVWRAASEPLSVPAILPLPLVKTKKRHLREIVRLVRAFWHRYLVQRRFPSVPQNCWSLPVPKF